MATSNKKTGINYLPLVVACFLILAIEGIIVNVLPWPFDALAVYVPVSLFLVWLFWPFGD